MPGCVQVPASGQPLVLMADAPTSGGYTLIASLPARDRALLAQVPPGEGQFTFHPVALAEAQACAQAHWQALRAAIQPAEDHWIGYIG
jgi:allophanate hydrolase